MLGLKKLKRKMKLLKLEGKLFEIYENPKGTDKTFFNSSQEFQLGYRGGILACISALNEAIESEIYK